MKCQKNRNNNKYISWPVNELDVVNVPENTRIASSARTCSLACGGAGLDIELVCEVSNKAHFYLSSMLNWYYPTVSRDQIWDFATMNIKDEVG